MAVYNIGKIVYEYKGEYSPTTIYEVKDVVTYNNGTYIYVNEVMSAGNPPTSSQYWEAMLNPEAMNTATGAASS